jgi:hypothetical protein
MASDTLEPEIEPDKTQPPVSALRYDTPQELYTHMPSLAQMTQHRPRGGRRCAIRWCRFRQHYR